MSKPRCRFYPNEIARRHCPAIKGPISARACREKFLVEIQCAPDCPFIEENLAYAMNRMLHRFRRRIEGDFAVPPGWIYEEESIVPFLHAESVLARFGQWYPDLTDREVLDVLEDFELGRRSAASKLEYEPRFSAGRSGELRKYLEGRLGYVVGGLAARGGARKEAEILSSTLEKIRASIQHHSRDGERGYLGFIIQFAESVEAKLAAGRILLR